jgi:hypothetical protein
MPNQKSSPRMSDKRGGVTSVRTILYKGIYFRNLNISENATYTLKKNSFRPSLSKNT